MVDLRITNAKIYTSSGIIDGALCVTEGKIVSIGHEQLQAEASYDAQGKLILPGVIDVHVHFREPGLEKKETFATGSTSALVGGVTTVCDMPNTIPPTNTARDFKKKREIALRRSYVNFGIHGGAPTSQQDLVELCQEKPVSIKIYCDQTPSCSEKIAEIYQWIEASNLPIPLTIHAESHSIINKSPSNAAKLHDLAWLNKSRNEQAEITQVKKIIELMTKYSIHTHICHVSCAETVNLIIAARKQGLPLTTEVTPHHLALSWEDIPPETPSGFFKVNPPLRMKRDNQALLMALKEGTLDMVASDHAPHTKEEKSIEDLALVPSGIVGTELILPLVLTHVQNKNLTLNRAVQIT
ncbi:MAG: dihydroorotase, partial [Candidatus Ranarchaeia archaeon]